MRETGSKARKLIPIGGSIGITVPKEFLEKNNLKPGDSIGVVYNSILMICVPKLPEEEQAGESG